ncbi:MAG: glutamate racemase [Candidatus Omnitrophota bacterium]|nr:MAG: glutamate racemase [Candidatus Omnitrophota bacterium]
MRASPIGVFDSGVGGLTVLREIEKVLPYENIIYLGDTARVPYGNKSKPTIIKFSIENILFLLKKRVKMVVIACNTASALALNSVKKVFPVPILGVVEAGAKKALKLSQSKRIGVIGTHSTIASKSYERMLLQNKKSVRVYTQACPLFVPLVEEGILNGSIVQESMRMYLKKLKVKGIDTIILGCTHYPLLKKGIARFLKEVHIVDSAEEVANEVRAVLLGQGLLNAGSKKGKKEFYVTDEPKGFSKLAKLFLKRNITCSKISNV